MTMTSVPLKRVAIVCGLLLLVGGWQAYRAVAPVMDGLREQFPSRQPVAEVLHATATGSPDAAGPTLAAPVPPGQASEEHPVGLEGTEPDGALQADATGHLRLSVDVRRFFDSLLTRAGEMSEESLDAWVTERIAHAVHGPAASDARRLWQQYGRFRAAASALPVMPGENGSPEAMEGAWQRIVLLQRQHFSEPEREAFFGAENAQNTLAFRRMSQTIASRHDPQPEQMPEAPMVGAMAATMAVASPEQPDDADNTQVDAERAAQFYIDQEARGGEGLVLARNRLLGGEAVARLQTLDEQRQVWRERLATFERERQGIMAQTTLPESERVQRVRQLLDRTFSATERLRVEASEHIDSDFPAN